MSRSFNLDIVFFGFMKKLISIIDNIIRLIGKGVSGLCFILVLVIVLDVILRYLFNAGSVATAELEWHFFSMIILLGASWAYQENRHVRVDLFYQRIGIRPRVWVDLLGTMIFLLPFCFVGAYKSIPFVVDSWQIGELSPDPGGLPARYLIKSAIPIGFILLGLQGISKLLGHALELMKSDD